MRQFRRLQRIKLRMPAQGGAEQVKGAGREAAPVTTHERLAPRGHEVKGTPSEARRSQSDACWVEMPAFSRTCPFDKYSETVGSLFPAPWPSRLLYLLRKLPTAAHANRSSSAMLGSTSRFAPASIPMAGLPRFFCRRTSLARRSKRSRVMRP
jgi:hypothetical protein